MYLSIREFMQRGESFRLEWFATPRIRRWRREALWIVVGEALAGVGTLVGVRLLTELLSADAYGELALGMTAALLLHQIVFFPLNNGLSRFYSAAAQSGTLSAYWAAARGMVTRATAGTVVLVLILAGGAAVAGFTYSVGIGVAASGFAVLSGYNTILDGVQNAARQRAIVAWHHALAVWGRFLLAAALILVWGSSSATAMWGYALSSIIVLASQGWYFRRIATPATAAPSAVEDEVERWKAQIWSFSWPFATWGLLTWAQMASDRWALELFRSTQDVGQFAVLYQLGYYPVMVASRMLAQVAGPVLYQRAGDGSDPEKLAHASNLNRKITLLIAIATIGGFVASMWLAKWIFRIFVAPQYAAQAYLLPWMIGAAGVFGIGQLLALQVMVELRARDLIAPKIIASILGVGLNLIGAKLYGVPGVVAATTLGSLGYLILVYVLSLRAA